MARLQLHNIYLLFVLGWSGIFDRPLQGMDFVLLEVKQKKSVLSRLVFFGGGGKALLTLYSIV